MSSYKHLVRDNNNLVHQLAKGAGIRPDLAQGILWFVRCVVKHGMDTIDPQIFSVVLSTFLGISNQSSIIKVYDRLTKYTKGLSVETFSALLCMFYTENLDMKIEYVFKLFDSNNDGEIDVGEISTFIKTCKCVTDIDEAEKDETYLDLCTMVLECLQVTTSEGIPLESFREKVKHNSLILSMLGQNLPSQVYLDSFKSRILGKTNLQMKETFRNIRNDLLFEPPDTSSPRYYPIQLDLP